MTQFTKRLTGGIIILILLLIGYLLFSSDVNNREAGLISLLLTILSFVVSYLISNYFAQETYEKAIEEVKEQHLANLKVYALNAAEKVGNLSNELTRLSIYLQQELDYEEDNLEMANHALSERIESSIHIINTLKSVNDTSLSDWRGVIGDELNEQKEEQLEREFEIKELVSRVEDLVKKSSNHKQVDNSKEIKEIKQELSLVLNSVSGNVITTRASKKPTKVDVVNKCPHCNHQLEYKQRQNEKSFKPIRCNSCGKRSTARWSAINGFYLEAEEQIKETIKCYWCSEDIEIYFSNVPHTHTICTCPKCSGEMKVATTTNGFKIDKFGNNPRKKNGLSDELIEDIEKLLPEQPWEKGIHKEIAHQLEVPEYIVASAITKLIEKGKFYPQVNGIVYTQKKE